MKELTQLIANDLQLNLSEIEFPDEDILREYLRKQVAYLMDKEFNKLIKDHLKYNKKIVVTLMNHKVGE